MKLDRNLQLKILEYLRDYYHCPADERVKEQSFFHNEDYLMNLKYLYEYGLVKGYESKTIGKREFSLGGIEITAKGLDLLEGDGGVGAILRTVVVKFDAENIRKIIEKKCFYLLFLKKRKLLYLKK